MADKESTYLVSIQPSFLQPTALLLKLMFHAQLQ